MNPNNNQGSRLQGSSSLHRGVIETGAWTVKNTAQVVEPIIVQTQPLPDLLDAYNIRSVDLLVVDAEGHDGVVVNQALYGTCTRHGFIRTYTLASARTPVSK